ncbi:hypothetical protein [Devosia sp. LjRoot3]|uniref:hypothetical protein n=1 Tax=Devosia sp. LjRoot3 TaxID=3342319 RepID=UPI003ECECD68
MGLVVIDGEVIVDHGVSDHLNTAIEGNPTQVNLRGMTVHCTFQRRYLSAKTAKGVDDRVPGDNCPLIYALKGADGLRVSHSSIRALNAHAPTILAAISEVLAGQIDAIVPMPSSSALARILAKRLARMTGISVQEGIFLKSNNAQAMIRAQTLTTSGNKTLSYAQVQELRPLLRWMHRNADLPYAAKNIKTRLRGFFDPLQLAPGFAPQMQSARYLLVDDLLATGETLVAARSLITAHNLGSVDRAVAWFGPVREPR